MIQVCSTLFVHVFLDATHIRQIVLAFMIYFLLYPILESAIIYQHIIRDPSPFYVILCGSYGFLFIFCGVLALIFLFGRFEPIIVHTENSGQFENFTPQSFLQQVKRAIQEDLKQPLVEMEDKDVEQTMKEAQHIALKYRHPSHSHLQSEDNDKCQ